MVFSFKKVSKSKLIAWKSSLLAVDLWTCQRSGKVSKTAADPQGNLHRSWVAPASLLVAMAFA